MRSAIHAVLILIGAVPWILAYFLIALCAALVWAADKIKPNATWGNCYSYSLHRWCQQRGALVLTFVEDARLLRIFPVVHATLIPHIHRRSAFETTVPVERKQTKWFPWWAFYFQYRVVRKDADTRPAPLDEVA